MRVYESVRQAGGRAEDEAVTYRNLVYREAQLCRNRAQRRLKLHHTDTHARTAMHARAAVSPEGTQLPLRSEVGGVSTRVVVP